MEHVASAAVRPHGHTESGKTIPLVIITLLFFMWGLLTSLNDVLIPHLKSIYTLNYVQAMLVQFCFFGAYFIVSLPAGMLIKKIGYQRGAVSGLVLAAAGCALFFPASVSGYALFLLAFFVLASGITILQVAANPYVTVLGAPATASSRLTLTQAFNSLGTTIAPALGGMLILSEGVTNVVRTKAEEAAAVQGPYLGGEVSIGSFLINFLGDANVAGLSAGAAAHYVSYYWGGAMIGRFIGFGVMRYVSPGKALAFNSAVSIILILLAIFGSGQLAMWSIIAVGLFNSIMFPTIFSMALHKLGRQTGQGSGILCMAIVGGALVPFAQGLLADTIGLQWSFFVPAACYIFILYFGVKYAGMYNNKETV
jgi:FHS family L-fucose permease-like MFS transporter